MTRLAVVCFLWRDGNRDYRVEHVDVLARMVRRNLPIEHDFICMSDETGFSSDVLPVSLPKEARGLADIETPEGSAFPSSYRRLWLFSEAATALADWILLLDIDCVITSSLAPLLTAGVDFMGWRPNYAWGVGRRLGGGTWLLKAGTHTEVWSDFSADAAKEAKAAGFRGSDQAWISYKLAHKVPVWAPSAGIYQSQDMRRSGYRDLPADARIVHFNGSPKPWELVDKVGWIRKHWR